MASLLFLAVLATGEPSPSDRLAAAVELFEFGEHETAAAALQGLLEPLSLTERASVLQARAYLGASLLLLGRAPEAKACFSLLLALDPSHRLDPGVFPPTVMAAFEDTLRASGLDRALEPTIPGGPRAEPRRAPHSPAWALIPLGVGQFANRQPVRGALFGGIEVGLFATAAASFLAFEGLKQSDGSFAVADVGRAETLQSVYLAAFWSGVAVAVIGVVEALLAHPGEP